MKKAHILIVEDSYSLSRSLYFQLHRQYALSQAPTMHTALALCEEKNFDLVLLDRCLPDGDGTELIEFLNRQYPHTLICIMSNRGQLPERIYGLNRGADHYLPKPFAPQEILALLRALLRRGKIRQENIIRRSEVELHLGPNLLQRESTQVLLTPRETQLMELFLRNGTPFLTLEQIHAGFWKNGLDSKSSHIHVYTQRLRKKLRQIRGTIVAHYGTGYELKFLE